MVDATTSRTVPQAGGEPRHGASGPAFPTDISVGIVSYNGLNADKLPRTVEALVAAGAPLSKITVVDVASTDGQVAWLRENWPAIRIIEHVRNIGPSPGRNELLASCEDEFLLLLDSDGQVCPRTVQVMREVIAEAPQIGVVSPVVVYGDDPEVIQYANVGLHFLGEACNPWQGRPLRERGDACFDVGVAPVCALLIRCEAALAAGLFDERYFVCKEDGDFIHRVNIAGYRVVEDPRAVVIHNCTPRSDVMFRRQLANGWHLMAKNYQKRTLLLIWPAVLLHACLQGMLLLAKGRGGAWLGAVKDFVAYLPALRRDRARVRDMRKRDDTQVLRSDDMLVRGDMASGALGWGLVQYNKLMRLYWRVVIALLYPWNHRGIGLQGAPMSDACQFEGEK